jgi:membrane protein DedA with SNARE-associated domain
MDPSLIDFIQQFGVAIVIINVFLNQTGLPMPALPALMLAGALASRSDGSLIELSAGAVLVCLVTDFAWYFAGRRYGNRVMTFLCRISLNPSLCAVKAKQRFARWSISMIVLGKFVPGLSAIAPPLAGATRMGVQRFAIYSSLGAALWVGGGIGAGIYWGSEVENILPIIRRYGAILALLIAVVVLASVTYQWRRHRQFSSPPRQR